MNIIDKADEVIQELDNDIKVIDNAIKEAENIKVNGICIKKDLSLKDTFMFLLWFIISCFVFFMMFSLLMTAYIVLVNILAVI